MRFIKDIASVVFPAQCHVCGKIIRLSDSTGVCTACLASLPRTYYWNKSYNEVYSRVASIPEITRAASWFFYSPASRHASLIHDFKYNNYPELARRLGRLMAEEIAPSGFLTGIDYIVPVPIHYIKLWRRTYNQTALIARGISDATGLPVIKNLRATRNHGTQTALSRSERQENVKDIFKFSAKGICRKPVILLLDDVCTTGATLTAAAEAITTEVSDARIVVLALASTHA